MSRRLLLLVAALSLSAVALSPLAARRDAGEPGSGAAGESGATLTIFAAASLTEALRAAAAVFEAERPGTDARLNLAGSQQLASQILAGARADLLISANRRQVERVAGGGGISGEPALLLSNALAIIVESGNPRAVSTLADLARGGIKVVLAAEEVPLGEYTRRVLSAAGLKVEPVSREMSAKQVVAKVLFGEADAAVVYRSDARAARGRVATLPLAQDLSGRVHYWAAVLSAAPEPGLAREFLHFLRSERGGEILRGFGFAPP